MGSPSDRNQPSGESAGEPAISEPADSQATTHLVVATVLSEHGTRGEVKCRLITDFPDRFRKGMRVYVGTPPSRTTLTSVRVSAPLAYLRFRAYPDRESARTLRGTEVLVGVEDAVSLPEGDYFWHQVIGLKVEDTDGANLGTIVDILETGANDVYVVRGPLGEILIPAIKDTLMAIEPEASRVVVQVRPGLLPEPVTRSLRRPRWARQHP